MSKVIDFNKPLSDEDKLWLHQWGYDFKIVENEQRFAQAKVHDAGKPIDVKKVLVDAGFKEHAPPLPSPDLPVGIGPTGLGYATAGSTAGMAVESGGSGPLVAESGDREQPEPFDEAETRLQLKELTVAELRDEIEALGAKPDGLKADLIDQLVELLRAE